MNSNRFLVTEDSPLCHHCGQKCCVVLSTISEQEDRRAHPDDFHDPRYYCKRCNSKDRNLLTRRDYKTWETTSVDD